MIGSKIRKGLINSFTVGFCTGCFPNKLYIKFENKKYTNIPLPLLGGLVGSIGFIFSPLLMINYLCNGTYFDRLIDKYDINLERYHQYDDKYNKYAFPADFRICLKKIRD